jgi:hypothetical protein
MDCGDASRGFFFFPHATKFLRENHIFISFLRSTRSFAWIGRGLVKEARHQACSNATGSSGAIALRKIAAEKNVIVI